jgi:putative ABC transport system permease protein
MGKVVVEWSMFKESLVMALSAIRSSKLRSILTLLGVAVGLFSIISVMTAVSVLQNSIEAGINQLGANTFQIQKVGMDFDSTPEERRKMRNRKNITYAQALIVREKTTLAQAIGIEAWQGGRLVFWGREKTNPNVSVVGENLEGIITNDWNTEVGRSFNAQDIELARPVTVLGKSVANKLFPPSISPIGQTVRVDGALYQVVGVFAKKGGSLGGNQDNFMAIPIATFFGKYGRNTESVNIMVKAQSREVFDDCIEQARFILRTARNVPPGTEDDFSYYSNDSVIKQFNDLTKYIKLGVLLVSSIALLAAGVGIMNIMLVSVTERTREIGIRKAIGAEKRDILTQFIIEAVILSLLGGVVGIALGIAGGNSVSLLANLPAAIPWDWVFIGLATCTVVGLVFGVYPAWKASALDPIDALRYE